MYAVCAVGELNDGDCEFLEQPYEPLFPLPDYKTVSETVLELTCSGFLDDSGGPYAERTQIGTRWV